MDPVFYGTTLGANLIIAYYRTRCYFRNTSPISNCIYVYWRFGSTSQNISGLGSRPSLRLPGVLVKQNNTLYYQRREIAMSSFLILIRYTSPVHCSIHPGDMRFCNRIREGAESNAPLHWNCSSFPDFSPTLSKFSRNVGLCIALSEPKAYLSLYMLDSIAWLYFNVSRSYFPQSAYGPVEQLLLPFPFALFLFRPCPIVFPGAPHRKQWRFGSA